MMRNEDVHDGLYDCVKAKSIRVNGRVVAVRRAVFCGCFYTVSTISVKHFVDFDHPSDWVNNFFCNDRHPIRVAESWI